VTDASLTCEAGQIYGLLGPNGAGKTTTLRCLATVLIPTSGTATVAGHDLLAAPEAVRRSIGFLSASTGNYARLTPRETLKFFASLYGFAGAELEQRVEETLKLFGRNRVRRPAKRPAVDRHEAARLPRPRRRARPAGADFGRTHQRPRSDRQPHGRSGRAVAGRARQVRAALDPPALAGGGNLPQDRRDRHGRVLGEGTIGELCERTKTKNLRQAFFALVKNEPSVSVVTEVIDVAAPIEPGASTQRMKSTRLAASLATRVPASAFALRSGAAKGVLRSLNTCD
jgi:ABC-type dipeptide/oligopeptide/nickel transport system ATPase component